MRVLRSGLIAPPAWRCSAAPRQTTAAGSGGRVDKRPLAQNLGDRARGHTRSVCVRLTERAGVICIREVGDRLKRLHGLAPQQLRQLGDVSRDPARLVARHQSSGLVRQGESVGKHAVLHEIPTRAPHAAAL